MSKRTASLIYEEMKQFDRDRQEALLSLDTKKILEYAEKYHIKILRELDPEKGGDVDMFWAAIHKARAALATLPDTARQESKDWLLSRGWRLLP